MQVRSDSFEDGARIPGEFAFAVIHPEEHVELSGNRSPHIAWSGLPDGTASVVIVCHDRDVPTRPDDVNQEGRTVPASLPRTDFFHWVLVDVDPSLGEIPAGSHSDGITAGGKGPDAAPHGRHGLNNYTQWFEGDADMGGYYHGYDGPGPPWNDELVHHYVFTVYALDVDSVDVEGSFDGPAVLDAIDGHVLGEAAIVGTYSLNPDVA